jgi:predicted transcriptional regulator YdeE
MLDIPFTVRKLPERTVIGISRRTSNADGRSVEDIPACWKDFLAQNGAAKIPDRTVPPVMYAVYSDYDSDWRGEYRYTIGCSVKRAGKIPEGMAVCHIPAQTYVVFNAKGQMPDEVLAIWALVWLSDLPRAYMYDFEVFDKRFKNPKKKEVDIYISVDPDQMALYK